VKKGNLYEQFSEKSLKMTIYKPNNPDRKQGKKLVDGPEVVIDDKIPLTDAKDNGLLLLVRRRPVTNTEVLARRRRIRCVLVLTILMLVVVLALAVTIFVHKRIWPKPYSFECRVGYYDDMLSEDPSSSHQHGVTPNVGSFDEKIEIDPSYERLEVPPVMNFRRSTVMHDFDKNLTAIVDLDHGRCYILPLNPHGVKPPKNLMDLMNKFQSGYYLPNAKIVRESYKVVIPPIDNIESLGYYIWQECQFYDTFHLVKNEDSAIVKSKQKRSASCAMAGNGFCLGGTYTGSVTCITLADCV
jgi:hypothetical protein